MHLRSVELQSIHASSVWNLSLRIGLRIALIMGALLYAFGLPIAVLYGAIAETENAWLPLVLVTILVPAILGFLVVLVAALHAFGAWLYAPIRRIIGGVQATLEVDGSTQRIVRIEPRQALRWLFAQVIVVGLLLTLFMAPFVLIDAVTNPAGISYLLYQGMLFGLAQAITILLAGIITLVLYNLLKQPISVTFGRAEQSTTLVSITVVVAATWMTVQSAISQIITVLIEQSGALGQPETSFFMSAFVLTPFLLLVTFLMQCVSYLIYNWGAQKWQPIAFELTTLSTTEPTVAPAGVTKQTPLRSEPARARKPSVQRTSAAGTAKRSPARKKAAKR